MDNSQFKIWNKQNLASNFQTPNTAHSTQSQQSQNVPQQNDYRAANEKLQIRIRYLEDFTQNLTEFEKSYNIIDLKSFLTKNYRRFCMLLDEVYDLKMKLEEEKTNNGNLINEQTQLRNRIAGQGDIKELQIKLLQCQQTMQNQEEYIQSLQNTQIQFNQEDFNSLNNVQLKEQINNLEDTIKQLSNEVDDLLFIYHKRLRTQHKIIQSKENNFTRKISLKNMIICARRLNNINIIKLFQLQVEGLRKQNQQLSDKLKSKDATPKSQADNKDKFSIFN